MAGEESVRNAKADAMIVKARETSLALLTDALHHQLPVAVLGTYVVGLRKVAWNSSSSFQHLLQHSSPLSPIPRIVWAANMSSLGQLIPLLILFVIVAVTAYVGFQVSRKHYFLGRQR